MASNRMVSTGIWSDERFTDLSAHAQLVYFRLVTGDDTTTAGASEVRAKRIAVDTNLERAQVEAALEELVSSDLVRRYDGWLWMPSWIRYQMRGSGFIRSSRQSARGMPDALRKAIHRSIDAHVGKTPSAEEETTTDGERTQKSATSRGKREPPPSLTATSPEPHRSLTGGSGEALEREVQDQDQDQDQDPDPLRGSKGPSGTSSAIEPAEEAPGSYGPAPPAGEGVEVNGEVKDTDLRRVDWEAIKASVSPPIAAAIERGRRKAEGG